MNSQITRPGDWANLDVSEKKTPAMLPGDYVRSALKNGMVFDVQKKVNPFKLGFVGGSDIHTGLSTSFDDNFFGAFTWMEPSPERAIKVAKSNKELGISYKGWQYATPGPTAVWARENTRGAIFDAIGAPGNLCDHRAAYTGSLFRWLSVYG